MKLAIRIIGGTLAVLALAFLGLWAASNRRDAGRMRGNIEIARPPEDVWVWLHQPDKLTQWVGWLAEVQQDSTSAPEGIGHRETWLMDDPRLRQKLPVVGTTTLWEPPHQLGVHLEVPLRFEGDVLYKLVDLGNGRTRLEQDGRVRYLDRFAALMEPLVTPDAMRKMVADMNRLKAAVEAQPFPADTLSDDDLPATEPDPNDTTSVSPE